MHLAICPLLPTLPENRIWYRAVQLHSASTPLNTVHTKSVASRYNEGNGLFEILYFAFDPVVAMYEVQAILGSPLHGVTLPNPYQAWTIVNVDVVLDEVTDLTDPKNQLALGASAQELTGD